MSEDSGETKKPSGSQEPSGSNTRAQAQAANKVTRNLVQQLEEVLAGRESAVPSSRRKPDPLGLNILCLDGGGVRGLSGLVLLSEAMNRLRRRSGTPKPANCFDIIAGSGTGGVIACMLGRLRMPIHVAIVEYGKLVQKGFSERKSISSAGGAYIGSNLRKALKAMVKEATGNEDEKIRDEREGGCKTMVFAMSRHNMNSGIPVIFRSYLASANPGPDCTIWEALYATMAHPDLFDSIDIGDHPLRQSFIGGEIGNSNPIAHVLSEVRAIYLGRHVSCVLSVGAGHPRTVHIPDSQTSRLFRTKELVAMKHMATDSERVAEDMARRFEEVKGVYFRLNVDQGMQNVDTDDWEKLGNVAAHTRAYLSKFSVEIVMNLAVQAVKDRKAAVAVAWIDGRIQVPIEQPIILKYCPAPTPVFTGWDKEIEDIRLCVAGDINERRVCVLYGLGGAGKSQLAFKVVETDRDCWARVIYVNASSKEVIEDTLRNLAIEKGAGYSHAAALDWLGCLRERWLLILDNVNNPSLRVCISDYFPHGNRGSILITTCLADLVLHASGPSSVIPVSSMVPEQALFLMSKIIGLRGRTLSTNDIHAANGLLKDLGHLALAIVHAGAYICHHPHVTISEYHELFLNGRQRMLEQYSRLPVRIDNYDKTVYTTWMLCYGLLERSASQQLLWLIAFLHPKGITTKIFRRSSPSMQSYHPVVPLSDLEHIADNYLKGYLGQFQNDEGHWDSVSFSEVISELASYSLIEFDRINLSYNIHVLVQDWVRSVILERIEDHSWLEYATTLLSRSVGSEDIDSVESLSFRRALGPHVSQVLLEHNGIIGVNHAAYFAEVFKARGEWDKEKRSRIQVKEELERRHWPDSEHQDILKSADHLIAVYRNQCNWADAESLCSYVWETRKRTLGERNIETIASAFSLVEILQKNSRLELARELQEEAKSYLKWLIHPYLATSNNSSSDPELELNRRGSLAIQFLQISQRLNHDQCVLVDTMFIYDSYLQEWPPQVANHIALLKLAGGVAALAVLTGHFDIAEVHYERILHAQELALGDGHEDTQKTMQNLADVYLALSKWDQANKIQWRVFDMYKRTFKEGDRSMILMKTGPCIIFTCIRLGKWRRAFLFIQAVRASSIDTQREKKPDLKCISYLVMGILGLTNNLIRFNYLYSSTIRIPSPRDSRALVIGPRNQVFLHTFIVLAQAIWASFCSVLFLLLEEWVWFMFRSPCLRTYVDSNCRYFIVISLLGGVSPIVPLVFFILVRS